MLDAVVLGSGVNGLAAAVTLSRLGKTVLVVERSDRAGGGLATAELTLPGFVHDVCAAVMALLPVSPFFRATPLGERGLELLCPPAAFAHPFDDGSAAVVYRSIARTADTLGGDATAYRRLLSPLLDDADAIFEGTLRPLRPTPHPVALARFGWHALRSAAWLAAAWFDGPLARGLFAGAAAHAIVPLSWSGSAAFGLMMCMTAHAGGWPIVRGGAGCLAAALVQELRSRGGEVATRRTVATLADLPPARVVLADVGPHQLARIAGDRLPAGYRRRLQRFRYGPGVCKLDWALSGPIPWRSSAVGEAGTVHLGGSLEEIARGEQEVWMGRHPARPFVLLVQPSLFDASRAPAGHHTAWAYCHVPNGSDRDMSAAIEAQVERFAPGFKDLVLARSVTTALALERRNPNLVGGDIAGGANDLLQLLARPTFRRPYSTPVPGLYLCSASTPPGGGVHGMSGVHAARAAAVELR
jgi:phytoene dehydrogenase-like protein